MVSFIIYRLIRRRRLFRRLTRTRVFYVALFFITMWLVNAGLFYYSEHIIAGRPDIDLAASLYWSIITMATIGYGDITPVRGLGWIVAGFAALMGILAYTLTVSVIADWFLSTSMRRSMGLMPLKKKKVLVIGSSDACREIIDELLINGLGDQVGWLTEKQPRGVVDIDYLIGDPGSEYSLRKAGVAGAEHIYLCLGDDSKTIHTALLLKHMNRKARIYAVVSNAKTEELLKEAGVEYTVSTRLLGRTIASAIFEPTVLEVLSDLVTARGRLDLIEVVAREKTTIKKLEEELSEKNKRGYKAIIVKRKTGEIIGALDPDTQVEEGDRIVLIEYRITPGSSL